MAETKSRSTHYGMLWAVVLVSAVLKLTLVVAFRSSPIVLDERDYLQLAQTLATEGRYVGTFRPPLYPAYLALMLTLGWDRLGIGAGQVVFSTVSLMLVYRIARRTLNPRAATVAAGLFAFDPVLIMFTHRLWSETLFILFLAAAMDLLTAPLASRRVWPWLPAGLLLGLAGLTRPMVLSFVPLLLPWAVLQSHRARAPAPLPITAGGPGPDDPRQAEQVWMAGVGRFAVLCLAGALVVLPWTIRNVRRSGTFILVDSNGPFNLLVGNQPEAAFVDKDDFWSLRFGLVEGVPYQRAIIQNAAQAQRTAVRQALDHIHTDPGRFLKKFLWEAGHLWTVDSFLLRHLRNGWYGSTTARGWTLLMTIVSVAFFVVLVLSSLVGLAVQPPSPFRGLALLLLLHATILFGVTYSLSRYNLPLHAILVLPAASVLSHPHKVLSALRRTGFATHRNWLLLLGLLALGCAWAHDLPLVGDMLTTGGSAYVFRTE
ncbi:MAG: glycosyltransferase family 39 protein [Planctomycetota bacterium]